MKSTYNYLKADTWANDFDESMDSDSTLISIFSEFNSESVQPYIDQIRRIFPQSVVIGCSTAGQFINGHIFSSSVLVTVTKFEKTIIKHFSHELNNSDGSFQTGMALANNLKQTKSVKSVFVLSKGLEVNGTQLIEGFCTHLNRNTILSGGLAADEDRFQHTWVINTAGVAEENCVSALGFYGENIHIATSSRGGWDMIGIDRKVTRSRDNLLFELDGKPALELYKQYLGVYAKQLPSSGLMFPLAIVDDSNANIYKVRTIIGINHDQNSITFAGDIPTGSTVRLMHANLDRIIDGATQAAEDLKCSNDSGCLTICISCVGRRLILKQRAEEEIETINKSINQDCCTQTGFYSYGEISPLPNGVCDLHNQTMTITKMWES